MSQIRDNKQKQLARDAAALPFVCAWIPAGTTRTYVVRTHMAGIKEAAP
jgi:hypothetical protein